MSPNLMICQRCNRPVLTDTDIARDILESMHCLCFHLEFEHPGDPDLPCTDPSCHVWRLQVYEEALRGLGLDPDAILTEAIRKRWP